MQSDTESMLIINCNDEAMEYLWFRPTTNTIAYFPLKDDVLDIVQGISLTNSWTKETIWRTFTGSTTTFSDRNKTSPTKFISIWIKINSWLNWTSCCTQLFDLWTIPCCYVTSHSDSVFRNTVHFNNGSSRPRANTGIQQGTWYHLAYWYYNGTVYMRVNNVKTQVWTNCQSSWGWNDFIRINGVNVNITCSDYIMEKTGWTDEELTKYWNKTKKNYWYT